MNVDWNTTLEPAEARPLESLSFFSQQDLASTEQLKRRYRQLIKVYHPDRHPRRADWANGVTQKINQAYAHLRTNLRSDSDTPLAEVPQLIKMGDQAVRRAVLMGWLTRSAPPQSELRNVLSSARDALLTHPFRSFHRDLVDFYVNLFTAFLTATESGLARPLPHAWNSTRFFKDLRGANRFLDKGIRDFYHHGERGSLEKLATIPLSYLGDAIRYYTYLRRRVTDTANGEVITSRITIARAFQTRVHHPELTVT